MIRMIHSTAGRNSLCCECHIKSLCLDLWSSSLHEKSGVSFKPGAAVYASSIKEVPSLGFHFNFPVDNTKFESYVTVTGFFGKLNLGTFVQTLMEDVQ